MGGPNGHDYTHNFVTKMSADGSTLLYSTFLGDGKGTISAFGIAVDSDGYAYVAGWTTSKTFPTLNAIQSTFTGSQAVAFVSKINPTGSGLVYSTFLAGNGTDQANAIAVDSSGDAYVTGSTTSTNFYREPLSIEFHGVPRTPFIAA